MRARVLARGGAGGSVPGFHGECGIRAALLLLGLGGAVLIPATAPASTSATSTAPLPGLTVTGPTLRRTRARLSSVAGLRSGVCLTGVGGLPGLLAGTGGARRLTGLFLALCGPLAPGILPATTILLLTCDGMTVAAGSCGPPGTTAPRRVGARFVGTISFGHPSMLPAAGDSAGIDGAPSLVGIRRRVPVRRPARSRVVHG